MGENCGKTSNFGGIMEILCDFAQKTDKLWENCVKIAGLCEKCVVREFVCHMGS